MEFKQMAQEMTDREIKLCMSLLFDGSMIDTIERKNIENSIRVSFSLMHDVKQKKYNVNLLPDEVNDLSDSVRVKPDGEYMYQQFMIAKGYSEYWKDNIFI